MADREKRILDELEHCNENIRRTKELIAYHRDVLKKQERKAEEIKDRLKKEKVHALFEMIDQSGYDVDLLKQAVLSGKLIDTQQHNNKPTVVITKEEKTDEIQGND